MRHEASADGDPKLFPTQLEFTADGSTLLSSGNEWTVGESLIGKLDRWTIHSNRELELDRRAMIDRAAAARQLCDQYENEQTSPQAIATAIRADTSLEPTLQQAALNEVLRRLW